MLPGASRQESILSGGDEAAARSFLARTFGWMFVGLALSGAIAAWFAASGDTAAYFEDHLGVFLALIVAEVAIIAMTGLGMQRISAQTATTLYCLFAGINGVLFSVVFSVATTADVAPAFLAAAAMFGGAALYGDTTKRDISSSGFLIVMAFGGLMAAALLNAFFASDALYWLVTFAGVLIFAAMTAWTVQALKQMGVERSGGEAENAAIFGAILLSLEFLNILLYALRFFQGSGGGGAP